MSAYTSIAWTDMTWNPVRGCALVSAGCQNCYAMKTAHRFGKPGMAYAGLTELGPHGPRWNGTIRLVPEALDQPLHWKKPRRIFVNSMSDLFHEDVPDDFIKLVLRVIAASPLHTFQVLTKRPHRMRSFMAGVRHCDFLGDSWGRRVRRDYRLAGEVLNTPICSLRLTNLWLGVSIEDQATADERIPMLLQTPAAVRWISAEPLLGPIVLDLPWPSGFRFGVDEPQGETFDALRFDDRNSLDRLARLDWVVVGGESGPHARPCDLAWIRSIVESCHQASVPVFVKQLGADPFHWIMENGLPILEDYRLNDTKGEDISEWPQAFRRQEWPQQRGRP